MIALSTAYKEALIGIEIKGKQAFKSLDANCKHSENLLPAVDSLLEEMKVKLKDNQEYCVIIGPGSFTGLRISSALVKGFLAGEKKKNILPLTTFDLMAYSYIKNFSPNEEFACIINALSGKYFICKYDVSGHKIGQEKMIEKKELDDLSIATISLAEEGIGRVAVSPTAEELLALAKEKFNPSCAISAGELVPLYIRKSQAEDTLEEKEKNKKNYLKSIDI